ncbi:MAG: ROK family protein [Pseudomonadota bacterium]
MADVVSDLGGTNVRFATVAADGRTLTHVTSHPLTSFADFSSALTAYASGHLGDPTAVARIAIGAAGPVSNNRVQLTNAPWTIDAADLKSELGCRARLVNDLQAVASAIPHLTTDTLESWRGEPGSGDIATTAIALNVGTGFGASALHTFTVGNVPTSHAAATEAGHISLPLDYQDREPAPKPTSDGQASIEPATFEDVLSGRGLVELVARTSGVRFDDARAVIAAAGRPEVDRALAHFGWLAGRAARDLVLAHGAWGGIYLFGSVLEGWAEVADRASFFSGFDGPNPMAAPLSTVPVIQIKHPQAALVGLISQLPK